MDEKPKNTPQDSQADGTDDAELTEEQRKQREKNPPWTTTGKITSPKFGSAGSGGAEYEPGPDRN